MSARLLPCALFVIFATAALGQTPPPQKYSDADLLRWGAFFYRLTWAGGIAAVEAAQRFIGSDMRAPTQREASLTSSEATAVNAAAADCNAKLATINDRLGVLLSAGALAPTSPAMMALRNERATMVAEHIEQIRAALDGSRFARLDLYVHTPSTGRPLADLPAGRQSPAIRALPDWAKEAERTGSITWLKPLEYAAELLGTRYSKQIAYEDPVWRWRGELEVLGVDAVSGREIARVKPSTLVLPKGLTPDKTPILGAAELASVVNAFERQNPENSRFRVLDLGAWLDIVPTEVRDESGALVPAGSMLDTSVSVPVASRLASEHLIALCQAVTAAYNGKITLQPNAYPNPSDGFNGFFAANGYIHRGSLRSADDPIDDSDERPYMVFTWGTPLTTAREALADLTTRSRTTMTWHLDCGWGFDTCWLNMLPVWFSTGTTGSRVMANLDRCSDCRPIPTRKK